MAGLPMLLFGALLEFCSGVSVNRGGYPTFNDEIPFKITWPGAEFTLVCCLLADTVSFSWMLSMFVFHLRCLVAS